MNPKIISDAFAAWIRQKNIVPFPVLSAFSPEEIPPDGALVVSCTVDDPHQRNTFGGFRADVFFRLSLPVGVYDTFLNDFYAFFESVFGNTPAAREEMNEFFGEHSRVRVASFACRSFPEPSITELGYTYEVEMSVVGELISFLDEPKS